MLIFIRKFIKSEFIASIFAVFIPADISAVFVCAQIKSLWFCRARGICEGPNYLARCLLVVLLEAMAIG